MIFSWQMAEELAAEHMRQLGFTDARRTPPGIDGGIDVASTAAVAQVKHQASPVGGPVVQQLRGAAHGVEHALFYASGGFTSAAVGIADSTVVALFEFTATNEVWAVNEAATRLLPMHEGIERSSRVPQAPVDDWSRRERAKAGILRAQALRETLAEAANTAPDRSMAIYGLPSTTAAHRLTALSNDLADLESLVSSLAGSFTSGGGLLIRLPVDVDTDINRVSAMLSIVERKLSSLGDRFAMNVAAAYEDRYRGKKSDLLGRWLT